MNNMCTISESDQVVLLGEPHAAQDLGFLLEERVVDRESLLLHLVGPANLGIPSADVLELLVLDLPHLVVDLSWLNVLPCSLLLALLHTQQLG